MRFFLIKCKPINRVIVYRIWQKITLISKPTTIRHWASIITMKHLKATNHINNRSQHKNQNHNKTSMMVMNKNSKTTCLFKCSLKTHPKSKFRMKSITTLNNSNIHPNQRHMFWVNSNPRSPNIPKKTNLTPKLNHLTHSHNLPTHCFSHHLLHSINVFCYMSKTIMFCLSRDSSLTRSLSSKSTNNSKIMRKTY